MQVTKIKETAKALSISYTKLNDSFVLTSKDKPSDEFKAAWNAIQSLTNGHVPTMSHIVSAAFVEKSGMYIIEGEQVTAANGKVASLSFKAEIADKAYDPLWLELENRARQYILGARAQQHLFVPPSKSTPQ